MKKLLPVIAALIAAALIVYLKVEKPERHPECIETTGLIEATEVNLGPKIPGRIEWLCCNEGDNIKSGDIAIRLDDKELKARVEHGKKSLKGAEASLRISEANLERARLESDAVEAEAQAAGAEVSRAAALTEDAKKNLQRISALFKDGLVSERDLDSAKVNYDASYAYLESANAHRRAADAKLKTSVSAIKAAEAQVASAKVKMQESQAGLTLLETQLREAEIVSPIDGVVVYKAFEKGEVVNAGAPIYTIHYLKNIWARIDVEETITGEISLGNPAKISASAIPGREFNGEVIEIGREGEFATQRDVTRGRPDIRTFRVKIGLKEPNGLLKPGMTVKAKVYCR